MKEIWKDIIGYEERYQVSNIGRIKRLEYSYVDTFKSGRYRLKPERIMKTTVIKNGYVMVDLNFDNIRKRFYVHRLVAQAFIPNPNNFPCVNHKDENKQNNSVDNLEWCDYFYNNSYGTSRKRMVKTRIKNGTYCNVSNETRNKISNALKGKSKSKIHCQHISEGLKKLYCQKELS